MDPYFEALSQYRRRNYEKCIEICNTMLENKIENSSTMFEGVWQLKMRALTQRVFIDDLEAEENEAESEELEFERIATAARPGTSIKTAFTPRPGTRLSTNSGRPRTATRPLTGIVRPGTASNRPGSALNSRPQTRCGTARRVCMTSAAAYTLNDKTSSIFQASRLNPTIYAEKLHIVKPLFQFLFYHEKNPAKAFMLCETQKSNWWWDQQHGRCLILLNQFRKAEEILRRSLSQFSHPDTYLLLCKTYHKLEEPLKALQLLDFAIEKMPWEACLRIQKARIHENMMNSNESIKIYKITAQINPINAEALACIAVHLFYDNQPEMALMYYRRILSLGAHSAELYCNIALCCLYSGTIDLVLPCFQRAIRLASTSEQRSDIWYNLSFAANASGDFNLAKRCLKLSLSLVPSNVASLNNLGVLLAQNGEMIKAKSYLLAASQNASDDCYELQSNLKVIESF